MRPAVFADLELATALQRATAEHKLLLVDATATWCGPCQMMDRTTWVDPDVISWLGEHAVAIQIDVDARKETASELHIQAMPTIIAFVEGKELDRVVGAKPPRELLAWLDGVMRGETSHAVLERTARAEPTNISVRLDYARDLTLAGRYDQALVEGLWLWDHMLEHDRGFYGVRLSYLASELETILGAYAPARAAISELRDRAAPPAVGPVDVEKFSDWKCLNRVLGEPERTLAWYDALPATRRESVTPLLEPHIITLLVDAERWGEAGALYHDPLATMNRLSDMVSGRDHPAELIEHLHTHLRMQAAQLVRALRAARRIQDADAVAERARQIDPSDEMRRVLAEL